MSTVRLPSDFADEVERAAMSGECKTYRPGQWEWAPRFWRDPGESWVCLYENGLSLNAAAYVRLGNKPVMVGYDGARELLCIKRAPDSTPNRLVFKASPNSGGARIGGRSLAMWLKARGMKLRHRYPATAQSDMLVISLK